MISAGPWRLDSDELLAGLPPIPARERLEAELLLGVSALGSSPGIAVGAMQAVAEPHLGWLGTLTDLVMGNAYAHALGEGWSCVTVSLRLDALAPMRAERPFLAWGICDDSARAGGVLSAIVAQDDVPVAKATSRFSPIRKPPRDIARGVASLQDRGVSIAEGLGLEASPWAPAAVVRFPTGLDVANPSGVVHGGLQIAAGAEAILRSDPAATPATHELAELSIAFLAPLPAASGSEATLHLGRVHTGRSSFRARAEIIAPGGAVATVIEAAVRRRPAASNPSTQAEQEPS